MDLQPDEVVRTVPDTGTELDVGTATTIELEVNPDTEAMPFLLPEPTADDTYQTYLQRLPVGSTTTNQPVIELVGDPTKGPNAVLKVTPAPGSRVTKTTPVTITTNPPDWPMPGGGGGSCNCGAIDFSPLENVSYGSHFPFGIYGWVQNAFGAAAVPQEPEVDITETPQLQSRVLRLQFGSNAWENTYRPPIWLAIEFLLTLTAIWVMASKVFGFGDSS